MIQEGSISIYWLFLLGTLYFLVLINSQTHAAPSYSAMVSSDKQGRVSDSEEDGDDDNEELQKVLQVRLAAFCIFDSTLKLT